MRNKLLILLVFLPFFLQGQNVGLWGFGTGATGFQGGLSAYTPPVVIPSWLPGTGRWDTITINDTVYLKCLTIGTVYQESTKAYGTWEFTGSKSSTASNLFFNITSNNKDASSTGGYQLVISTLEAVRLLRRAESVLNSSANAYVTTDTRYSFKINRASGGVFTDSIKGGSYGSSYILKDVSGGAGTNPVTNNIYTTSEYIVISGSVNDLYSDSSIIGGLNLTWNTAQIDEHLQNLIAEYTETTPTENLTLNMSGNRFAVPINGVSNQYLISLDIIFSNAGYSFTPIINLPETANIYLQYLDDYFSIIPPTENFVSDISTIGHTYDGFRNEHLQDVFSKFNNTSYSVDVTLLQKDTIITVSNETHTWDSIFDDYDEENLIGPYEYYLDPRIDIQKYAMVSFIDDDGDSNSYNTFRPVMISHDAPGIIAMITIDNSVDYFHPAKVTVEQCLDLQNNYGFTIANHSTHHLSPAAPEYTFKDEWLNSREKLGRLGFDTLLAIYPGGQSTHTIRDSMQITGFSAAFGISAAIHSQNFPPISTYLMGRKSIDSDTLTFEHLKSIVDLAYANKDWLMFYFHTQDNDLWGNYGSEAGYPSEWIVPGDEVPSGWRPQIGNKLYTLWQIVGYIKTLDMDIVNYQTALDRYGNIDQVGDYTAYYPYNSYYVVGADSSIMFRPL